MSNDTLNVPFASVKTQKITEQHTIDSFAKAKGLSKKDKSKLDNIESNITKGGFWSTAFGRTLLAHNATGKVIRSVAGILLLLIPNGSKLESHITTIVNIINNKNMANVTQQTTTGIDEFINVGFQSPVVDSILLGLLQKIDANADMGLVNDIEALIIAGLKVEQDIAKAKK